MPVETKALSPELLKQWLHYFDNVAFTDNSDWGECYCCFFHLCSEDWKKATRATNRAFAQQAIMERKITGYLAFENNAPVGWCNVNLKENFARIAEDEELQSSEKTKVASVVCFNVAPVHRGKGIAKKLLQHAINDCTQGGIHLMEAYPRNAEVSAAGNYHGPLKLYPGEGFRVTREFKDYSIVQKALNELHGGR